MRNTPDEITTRSNARIAHIYPMAGSIVVIEIQIQPSSVKRFNPDIKFEICTLFITVLFPFIKRIC